MFTICFHKVLVFTKMKMKIIENEKQFSIADKSSIGLHCFQKHVLSMYHGKQRKEEYGNFYIVKGCKDLISFFAACVVL